MVTLASVSPVPAKPVLTRAELLVAARAAAAWPLGCNAATRWFSSPQAAAACSYPHPVQVALARRWGCPAVAVTAYRGHLRGDPTVPWPEVWAVQVVLIALVRVGDLRLNEALTQVPALVAQVLQDLAAAQC